MKQTPASARVIFGGIYSIYFFSVDDNQFMQCGLASSCSRFQKNSPKNIPAKTQFIAQT